MRCLLFPQAEITALPAAPGKKEFLGGAGNGYPKFAYYTMKGSDGLYPSDRNPQFLVFPLCENFLFPADGKRSWIATTPRVSECHRKGGKRVKTIKDLMGTLANCLFHVMAD